MAVSRLASRGPNIRAINAAKAVGRNPRADSILNRLATISQSEALAIQMLDRVICADPILGQRVPLSVAAYCTEKKLPIPGSLAEGTTSLGYAAIRQIIQIVGLHAVHEELAARSSLNAVSLTNQAVAVAVGCEFLARKASLSADLGFSSGLFTNLGVPVLAFSERSYATIESTVAGGTVQLDEAEQQSLGCTHAEAGYCLLTDYNFPETICTAVGSHGHASQVGIVAALNLAESFAHQLGFDGGFAIIPKPFDEAAFAALGGSETDAANLAGSITSWNSLANRLIG